jgi:uracil-DNA glycosylase
MNLGCTLCSLSKNCRTKGVYGTGPSPCPLMLIGEAPGYDEDVQGKPFVGQAGKLLDMILSNIGLSREACYVTNVIKCRPPNNKLPGRAELTKCWERCRGHFLQELIHVKPKVVVLMGGTAVRLVSGNSAPITRCEGLTVYSHETVEYLAAFHPAYVLRAPSKEFNLTQTLRVASIRAYGNTDFNRDHIKRFDYESRD